MQEARRDNWIRCPFCGHKLFLIKKNEVSDEKQYITLETKCHSCKGIVDIRIFGGTKI